MRIELSLLLVCIVAINCAPQGGAPVGTPCNSKENLTSCTCKNGDVYSNQEELDTNCSTTGYNTVETCICVDGTTWPSEGAGSSEESGASSEESSEESG